MAETFRLGPQCIRKNRLTSTAGDALFVRDFSVRRSTTGIAGIESRNEFASGSKSKQRAALIPRLALRHIHSGAG